MINVVLFLQHTWGVVQSPYVTYRILSRGNHLFQALPFAGAAFLYFAWAVVLQNGLHGSPFILTVSLATLCVAAVATYVFMLVLIFFAGKSVGGTGSVKAITLPWAYSLVPTLVWFFGTSVLWLVFPPPRTTALTGRLLSFVYLTFSFFMLYWKSMLYYLTLRFGMRLDLRQIVLATVLIVPFVALYSYILYIVGIFRIPFV